MRLLSFFTVLLPFVSVPAAAQDSVRVDILVLDHDERRPDARVRLGDAEARSDTAGRATFRVAPGRYRLQVTYEAFPPATRQIAVRHDTSLVVVLRPESPGR